MNKALLEYLAVAGAGAAGAVTRLFVGRLFLWTGSGFPVGTFIINITGSLFLGWFMTRIGGRITTPMQLAIGTGFVGAYTTFSTYMFESDRMLNGGDSVRAILYLVGSLVLGLIAVRAGVILGRRM